VGEALVVLTDLTVQQEGDSEEDIVVEQAHFDDGDDEKYLHEECLENCFAAPATTSRYRCAYCTCGLDEFPEVYGFQQGVVASTHEGLELVMSTTRTVFVCPACTEEGLASYMDDGCGEGLVTAHRVLGTGVYAEYGE